MCNVITKRKAAPTSHTEGEHGSWGPPGETACPSTAAFQSRLGPRRGEASSHRRAQDGEHRALDSYGEAERRTYAGLRAENG